ncbi:MAG TPA: type VI secretion system baseplate subunit TssF [Burkholderiaceae bacterium]|nr:type VI secretion system baseplate subunit TssF [Burkholderiaceae bacterium]
MDPGLLRRYNEELAHLREVGGEFARQFPKIAARLSLDGVEVADPYVERLLEGFAFMAARVQLKLEAEYPRFIQHLLEAVYPNALAPVPAMVIARFLPDLDDPNLVRGAVLPRGSSLSSEPRGLPTRCEFRTAHEVRVWPLEITAAQYFSHAPDLPLAQLPVARQVRGGLRIRLRLHGGLRFNQLPLEALNFHLSAPDETAYRLHELVFGAGLGTLVHAPGMAAAAATQWRAAESLHEVGYDDEQALLPETLRGFSGHRLLQEFAALPQRFVFFEVADLAARLQRVNGAEAEIVILLSRGEAALEALVDAASLALFCTPAINLFTKRLDRIQIEAGTWEHHVVPDRARPMDFEVHALESVTGYGTGTLVEQRFLPLYTAHHTESAEHAAYYTLRREPRLLSPRQKEQGPRSSYIGTEVFLSLVDPRHAPYREDVQQLAVAALVSNRDLPTLLPTESGAWRLDGPGPVRGVECLRGPTRPVQRLPQGEAGWALISQLTLNYLSIAGEDPRRAAAALRSLLLLQGPAQDDGWRRMAEGVLAAQARQVTRRLPFPGPLTFGTGVQIELEVDELAFQGRSAFLLGSVLDRFFSRQAGINCFTELRVRSAARGSIFHGTPRIGAAPLL